MPSIIGYTTEEDKQKVEKLVDEGKYEDKSEFVEKAIRYLLDDKHGE